MALLATPVERQDVNMDEKQPLLDTADGRSEALTLHLRGALERAAAKSNESMEALRVAVCVFTIALRDKGIAPEAVLIRLKAAIRYETLMPLWETSTWSGPHLHETVTTWCIKDYFSEEGCVKNG